WPPRRTWVLAGVGASMGGALGNALDRWIRVHERRVYSIEDLEFSQLLAWGPEMTRGFDAHHNYFSVPEHGVIDFVVVYFGPQRPWPAFNVADVALSVGMISVAVWLWRMGSESEEAPPSTNP